MRYIELNPLRASMVDDPSDHVWSSYHHNAPGKTDALIQPHLEYYKLGKKPAEQQQSYQALFQIPMELKMRHEIREATNKCWTLGDSNFKRSVSKQLARRVGPSAKGGD